MPKLIAPLFLFAALELFAQVPATANPFDEPGEVLAKAAKEAKELTPAELRKKFGELETRCQEQERKFQEEFTILRRILRDSRSAMGYNRTHYLWMVLLYHQERRVTRINYDLSLTELAIASINASLVLDSVHKIQKKVAKDEAHASDMFKTIDGPATFKHVQHKPPVDEDKLMNLARARLAAWDELMNAHNPKK